MHRQAHDQIQRVKQGLMVGFAALNFFVAGYRLCAQQPLPQPARQEPGAGAQVHTGTSSGIDADTRMQILLADHQYSRMERELDQLPPKEAQLYRGVLANRNNDPQASIQFLEPLLGEVTAGGNADHEKLLRKALAEDYLREGDWSKAAREYKSLDSRLAGKLSADERDQIEMPLKMLPLAVNNPPMTVDPCEPFAMQVSKDPLGLTEVPVFVDALPHSWMLDPTAPFNLIARSAAHEAGLKISDEAVTIHTLTGRPMQMHATVIPRFTIGGRITLHNVTAFVFNDSDFAFPHSRYQVQGVLGYGALQALGSLTITADDTIAVRPASTHASTQAQLKQPEKTVGARFYLDGDQIVVPLGRNDDERMFAVDAAGQQSYVTSRYFDEHASDFNGRKMELFTVPGTDISPQPAYTAETIPLEVGNTRIAAHYIQVLTEPIGSSALDDVYGVLGVDVLDQLRSYTFDYTTMRFSVVPE